MKKIFISIVSLFVVIAMISCGGSSVKQLTDHEILVKIYEAMNGAEWTESQSKNWLSEKPIGEWGGVKTNDEGRVITLRVQGDGVYGLIPAEIGGLTELEQLNINSKDFDVPSVIPTEIGNLTKLKSLAIFISANSKEDRPALPNLTTLVDLESLYIEGFDGTIPEYIGKLSKLKDLRLEGFEGEIPKSICELKDLEELILVTYNQPKGAVPECIGNLSKLKTLRIDYSTGLVGGIMDVDAKLPQSIWNLTNLETLFIRSVSNTGGIIPGDKVAKMHQLKSVTIIDCGLTGTIPPEFFASGKLTSFSIYRNELTGSIPSEIGNCHNLSILNLSQNQLTGNIPEGMIKSEKIWTFDLSGNQLSPNIPADLKAHPSFSKFKF